MVVYMIMSKVLKFVHVTFLLAKTMYSLERIWITYQTLINFQVINFVIISNYFSLLFPRTLLEFGSNSILIVFFYSQGLLADTEL